MMGPLKLIAFLGAVFLVASQELYCSSPSKFYIPNVKTNWIGAVEHCNRIGMRLVVVDTEPKQKEIVRLAQASNIFNTARMELWIGGNNLAQEGKFVWHATGMIPIYTNWNVGQPDNHGNNEHCIYMWYEPAKNWNWKWNDAPCSYQANFVCENVPLGFQ